MKKVVINKRWGGFGLSALATKELAKRKGRKCYFFKDRRDKNGNLIFNNMVLITLKEATESFLWYAYDCSNPHNSKKRWGVMTDKEKKADSDWGSKHSLYDLTSNIERDDLDLVTVVEELKDKANGSYARLKVVEIPDNVEFEIHEYDGMESVEEKHRSWG